MCTWIQGKWVYFGYTQRENAQNQWNTLKKYTQNAEHRRA